MMPTTPLSQAVDAYIEACDIYRDRAEQALKQAVKARYPQATRAEVLVILDESTTEHSVAVVDGNGRVLNRDEDWPDFNDDWWMEVTEGVCVTEMRRRLDL